MTAAPFHGSYAAGDVSFLLQPLALQPIADLHEKEQLIQSGTRHYSEMIGVEQLPSARYLALFHAAVEAHGEHMAADLLRLARHIRAARPGAITLVSLARAGTPVGVLLRRLLAAAWGIDAPHYSISVIRDRGVDVNALDHLLARHAPQSLVFVDGWTAKGTIAGELQRSLAAYAAQRGLHIPAQLFVLCDLSGLAFASGSSVDYLIPSALLNASVSGLVSRSVLNEQVAPGGFHGCLSYADDAAWQSQDLSRWFVDRMQAAALRQGRGSLEDPLPQADAAALRRQSRARLRALMLHHAVSDPHFIKPGIGEATRALLRREPRLLLLRDAKAADVRHLVQLAEERDVAIRVDPGLDLQAVAILRRLADG